MPSMRANSYCDGELWLRCPFCGDSETHRNKAHFSVNNAGVYYCFRCSKGGRLSTAKLIDLYTKAHILDQVLLEDIETLPDSEYVKTFEQLLPGPATTRKSMLDRFQWGGKDVFTSRNPDGELVGLAVADGRTRKMVGRRRFGFKGDQLISSLSDPIRLVEGPYDVIGLRDVCVYGLISHKHIRRLKGQFIILCPDGDVWGDERKLNGLLKCLIDERYKWGATIVAVERLEDNKDPDEVPYEKRWTLDVATTLEKYGGT